MAFRTLFLLLLASGITYVRAGVTVYGQTPVGFTATTSAGVAATPASGAAQSTSTTYKAYDQTVLTPPALPSPLPATQFQINLQPTVQTVQGAGIAVSGALFGLSIEMSVVTQVLGINGSFIQVPFLNMINLISERAGRIHIRVGGNTQDTARYVDSLADQKMIEKQGIDPNNPTATPALVYTMELFYVMANISSMVNAKWYLGVPFNDTTNFALQIAEYGQAVLGQNLLGLQVANEPDLYAAHNHRVSTYGPQDYTNEVGALIQAMQANGKINSNNMLIGPNIEALNWTPQQVWDTGFADKYADQLAAFAVEHYPTDNCAAIYGGNVQVPQEIFGNYLAHSGSLSGRTLLTRFGFVDAANQVAMPHGKEMILFETNTASCGGFPGISKSFGAALWGVDFGLQLAFSNFSHALVHVGGQDTYYNPMTPPPTGQSRYHEWTVGPLFYSMLFVSEALGKTNTSQVVDIFMNNGNDMTPGYAIYESGNLAKLAFINYMDDPTGNAAYTVTINIGGEVMQMANGTPAKVYVKYLTAPSVASIGNFTWGGQTLGEQFQVDGRLKGDEQVQTVNCDTTANTCQVKVPSPGAALVLLSDAALAETQPNATVTFSTTAVTNTLNTATVDASVLATSNGHSGKDRVPGSTSKGSSGGSKAAGIAPSVTLILCVIAGVSVLSRSFSR
ncbi:glycoside hydrolase family 79 protein [Abortiporus biennis]|nr:glycoside hydrolase family 79 protein [Abortiporus biennis]